MVRTRNPLLTKGVERYSRSVSYHKRGAWAKKPWADVPKKEETNVTTTTKKLGSGERVVVRPRAPKYYPAEDVKRPIPSRKTNRNPTKLRKSLTPGTVVILLAGRFRGRRVVFLKQLPSGLLLVSGNLGWSLMPLTNFVRSILC